MTLELNSIKWTFSSAPIRDPWFAAPRLRQEDCVKKNAKRRVYRIQLPSGTFFVKIHQPATWFDRLKMHLRPAPEWHEFEACRKLREFGIPCGDYVAFGRSGSTVLLVSRALEGYVTATEFWFRIACRNHALRETFLRQAAELSGKLNQFGIRHKDFHSGNLMVHEATGQVALIDLCAISFPRVLLPQEKLLSMELFCDFADGLEPDEISGIFSQAGFRSDTPWQPLWEKIIQKKRDLAVRTWKKRKAQILSGNSKFCRTEIFNGLPVCWRNSRWYSTVQYDPAGLTKQVLPEAQAEDLWLNSFLRELKKESQTPQEYPVGYRKNGDHSILFYSNEVN